jgi:hypothetical protein
MHETERLSALIGEIYDTALDPALWVPVLGKVRHFIGGWAIALSWKDAVAKRGGCYFTEGEQDPSYRQVYFDKYIKFDPFTMTQFVVDVEEPKSFLDVLPYPELIQTRIYKEWTQPQGVVDALMCLIDRSVTSVGFMVVFRSERDGFVDDATRQRARLIIPHIRRATLIGKVVDLQKAEAASFADTFDGISAGMFLVDAAGRLVHANAVGHAMLSEMDVLRAAGGRLVLNDTQADQALADTFAMAGDGDAAIGVKGVAVPIVALDGERYVARVLPLMSGARRQAGKSYRATAALFVHKAALETPSPPQGNRRGLQTHGDGTARTAGSRRGRRSSRSCRGTRSGGEHGQDPSWPSFRQDQFKPPGRPGQTRRRICQSARWMKRRITASSR